MRYPIIAALRMSKLTSATHAGPSVPVSVYSSPPLSPCTAAMDLDDLSAHDPSHPPKGARGQLMSWVYVPLIFAAAGVQRDAWFVRNWQDWPYLVTAVRYLIARNRIAEIKSFERRGYFEDYIQQSIIDDPELADVTATLQPLIAATHRSVARGCHCALCQMSNP